MPRLILKKNDVLVREFEFDRSKTVFMVGADVENDLVVDDENISSKHLKVERINNSFYLQIINTAFPTQFNGRPLLRRVQIVDGDEITLGEYSLLFRHDKTPLPAANYDEDLEIIGADDPVNVFEFDPTEPVQTPPNLNENIVFEQAISSQSDSSEIIDLPKLSDAFVTGTGKDDNGVDISEEKHSDYYLLAIHGPYIGKRYPLKRGDTKIGRDNTLNDIIIRNNEDGVLDPSVSRRHATVSYRNGQFFVTDKRSKTRTFVNQTKLEPTDEVVVHEGDEIEIVSDQKSTIFRLTRTDVSDFRSPRKAGLWWVRYSGRLFVLLSLVSIVVAAGAIGLYVKNQKAISQKPEQLKLVEEVWFLAPAFLGDRLTTATLAVSDLDGNGQVDIVFTDTENHLTALDGVTKTKLWQNTELEVRYDIPIVLADLNKNGLQDVLVVGLDGRLHAYDGANGAEIWLSPILGEAVSGPPVVDDFNDDGLNDVAICSQAGDIHIGYGSVFEVNWKRIATQFSFKASPSCADLDDDGQNEIFIGTEDGKLLTVTEDGNVAVLNLSERINEAAGEVGKRHVLRKPAAFGDLDGDGVPDMIAGSVAGDFLAMSGLTQRPIWHEKLHHASLFTEQNFAPVVGKLNDDNFDDVVLVTNQLIRVVAGSNDAGNPKPVLWDYYVDAEDYFVAAPALADFNKDGSNDVIIAARSGTVSVFDGKSGKIIAQVNNDDNPVISPLMVADVGADGLSDILFIREDGNIYKIQTNSTLAESDIIWGQAYGDARHTGRFGYQPPGQSALMIVAATFGILFICSFGAIVSTRKSRDRKIQRNQKP